SWTGWSVSINTWERPSGMPAATQRSQNTETMSVSGVPARPAWVSQADKSVRKFSFIPRLYRNLLSGRASNPDGSVDVYFGTKAPAGKESNRVPTNPSVASTIRAEEGILRQGVGAGGRRADCCAGGVIVTAGGTAAHRKLIIDLVNRYKLPTVYPYRYYAVDGDLIAYGPNTHEPVRGAAGYVDRILKGE